MRKKQLVGTGRGEQKLKRKENRRRDNLGFTVLYCSGFLGREHGTLLPGNLGVGVVNLKKKKGSKERIQANRGNQGEEEERTWVEGVLCLDSVKILKLSPRGAKSPRVPPGFFWEKKKSKGKNRAKGGNGDKVSG